MKIAVLLSGGVDSSVSLRLLKEQGYDVTAFYLKIWLEDELSFLGTCPWEEDLSYARAVCEQTHVPLEVISFQKEYFDSIVDYTLHEVRLGRTPNPDILCNNRVKFGLFLERIGHDFEKIASGHYARIFEEKGLFLLLASPDPVKDQTYFLSQLDQNQLSHILFPIGHLTKQEVREKARDFDLPNKDRKDSQGICFLGKLKFKEFLRYHLGEREGDIIEFESDKKVGNHRGYWFYTPGQRKDIGLSRGPWYVVSKDPASNRIFVSRNYHSTEKKRNDFLVSSLHWISRIPEKTELSVKLRHGPKKYNAHIKWLPDGMAKIVIDGNDQGIASGQFAVFYDGEICLGSGIIE
ncbi:tRNA 2-thiouridine(34) synthase MnmA [Candidatus Peregrinibacteria bacterium]|nr:tRNA 2-thiouridine(34) synthase MnmA [Candidatus Peregrinibacteria bacterium]